MGWCFTNFATRKQVIGELTEGWSQVFPDGTKKGTKYLAKQYKGTCFSGVLYAVGQPFVEGEPDDPSRRFILVALVRSSNYRGIPSWGYKDMTEEMGPYYYSCPKKYLAMTPTVANVDWRSRVLEWHKDHLVKLRQRRLARLQAKSAFFVRA